MTTVDARQRYTRSNPCPICGGGRDDPRGQGQRCYGFESEDAAYVHCSREEYAGGVHQEESGTFAHWLKGPCNCGADHRLPGAGKPKRNGHRAAKRWPAYNAHTGGHVADHVRLDLPDEKLIWWERPDGTKKLPEGVGTADLALYGIRELPPDGPVVVVEGEKAADALRARGVPAVGTVCGAGVMPRDDALSPLLGHTVYLWPDNDLDGARHMQRIGGRLRALGHASVKLIVWGDAPNKGDAADFSGADDELQALIAAAQPLGDERAESPLLAETLGAVSAFISQYVSLTAAQLVAIVLWVGHTHAFAAADATPYLAVGSAEKRSGKSRLLEVLALLAARPWLTGRTTAAALVRKVHKDTPALLIDEADAAFKGGEEYSETLRGVLNTGHRRGGVASLCVGQGANLDVKDFNTYCPKAIAGIGKLPDTVADRAIPIGMKRQRREERVERFRHRKAKAAADPIRSSLAAWASVATADLTDAQPEIPDTLDDRAADGWEPLFAIADLAGGDWPTKARAAALTLSGVGQRDDDSIGVRLLTDIRATFGALTVDRLSSAVLAAHLAGIEESPWGSWGKHDKPIDARALAVLLKPYGVTPKQVRIGSSTLKGYTLDAFGDAFARYIPPSERNTETSESDGPGSESSGDPKQSAPQTPDVSDENTPESAELDSEPGKCFGVSAKTPVTGARVHTGWSLSGAAGRFGPAAAGSPALEAYAKVNLTAADEGQADIDASCAVCGEIPPTEARFTGGGSFVCAGKCWASAEHYENTGHGPAEALRLARVERADAVARRLSRLGPATSAPLQGEGAAQ